MCHSCQVVRIQGKVCHEFGCPEAFKSETRECAWCGSKFTPKHSRDKFCDESCYRAFYGIPDPDEAYND